MYTVMHAFERDRLLDLLQGSLLPPASIALSFVPAWGWGDCAVWTDGISACSAQAWPTPTP